MQNQDKTTEWETIDLRRMVEVVDRRKWLILGIALGMSLLTAVVVVLMTPTYRATATVLIEARQSNVVAIEEVYGLDVRNQQYYDTQFAILRSRPIAEAVVVDLDLLNRDFRPAIDPEASVISRNVASIRLWYHEMITPAAEPGDTGDFDKTVQGYLENLAIEPLEGTQLVQVHFQSPDKSLAAEVANTHATAYINSIRDARLAETETASSWMSRRVNSLQEKLAASEERLQEYVESENIIGSDDVQALQTQEINDLSTRLIEARRNLSEARIAYEQVQSGFDPENVDGPGSVPLILRDEAVQNFREIEAAAERNVAELVERYGPQHPQMVAAQAELATASENLRRQQEAVATSVRSDYAAAQSDVTQLERELAASKARFQDVGRKQSELSALQREVEVNRQLYDIFYNRIQETEQTEGLESANAKVMSPAILPIKPFKPNKRAIVGLVFIATLLAGVIASFLHESMMDTVRSTEDIEKKLGVPMLGMVPWLKATDGDELNVSVDYSNSDTGEFGEAIRVVRTGLSFDSIDSPYRTMLVTSSISDEGKSTISISLARAFSQMERTLLIDGDLRRPSVSKLLAADENQPGLTELLYGQAELEDCIFCPDEEDMHVLASGSLRPDPLILFSSKQFEKLLAELKKSYDRIIIDTPPVLPVSDTVVLSRHADSIALVIKADSTSTHKVRHTLKKLNQANANISGAVLNFLDLEKAAKYSDYGYGGYYEPYDVDAGPMDAKTGEHLASTGAFAPAKPRIRRVAAAPENIEDLPPVGRLLMKSKQQASSEQT